MTRRTKGERGLAAVAAAQAELTLPERRVVVGMPSRHLPALSAAPPPRSLPLTRPLLWRLSAGLGLLVGLFFLAGVIVGVALALDGGGMSPPLAGPMAAGPMPSPGPPSLAAVVPGVAEPAEPTGEEPPAVAASGGR